jgi:hypothetical protein
VHSQSQTFDIIRVVRNLEIVLAVMYAVLVVCPAVTNKGLTMLCLPGQSELYSVSAKPASELHLCIWYRKGSLKVTGSAPARSWVVETTRSSFGG